MRHSHFLTSAIAILALHACGSEPSEAAEPPVEVEAQEVAETSTPEPEIGDKVPEPAPEVTDAATSDEYEEITWEDLMPEGEEERIAQMYQAQMASLYSGGGGGGIAEGSAADQAIQIGTFNTVKDMDGVKMRLPGYTVPFEYGKDAQITEFLLVPYYGACLHAPPPPPNQTVFVRTETPIKLKDLSQAVWIEGTIKVQKQTSDLADAAYTIEMTDWEPYEY
ncbi:DUF3299 domain-containing protein [Henriciella litoralis]|uniref:DUF3299 domain-containing protein n=1 Tax=Henriciella litoralis TaxID=568102 RepID=UPI0009FEEAE4|nr:DUF3299 domain-containing protein [Henriciella litoralis]